MEREKVPWAESILHDDSMNEHFGGFALKAWLVGAERFRTLTNEWKYTTLYASIRVVPRDLNSRPY